MSCIQFKYLEKGLAVVAGWCLLALVAGPLAAQEDAGRNPLVSPWGPISIAAKGGSFEADLVAALLHPRSHLYVEIDYGESDLDLPGGFGGGNIDVSYWSLGLRGYPWVVDGAPGSFDFAVFAGVGIGVYDLESPLGPLTGAKSGYSLRAGLEIRYSNVPDWGVELQWVSHEVDVPGADLDFDGFLLGVRYHFGTRKGRNP